MAACASGLQRTRFVGTYAVADHSTSTTSSSSISSHGGRYCKSKDRAEISISQPKSQKFLLRLREWKRMMLMKENYYAGVHAKNKEEEEEEEEDVGNNRLLLQDLRWIMPVNYMSVNVKESSAPSSPSATQIQERVEKQDFYANCGYAIRLLREELPSMFYKELTLDIYRDDIVFKDPMNTFVGIDKYKFMFWSLRFHGKMLFKHLWMDILRMWNPSDNVIMVRWTVTGNLRLPWKSYGRFDGISQYKLDSKGKIYEHKVDNVAFISQTNFHPEIAENFMAVLACPPTARPTYFQTSTTPTSPFEFLNIPCLISESLDRNSHANCNNAE